MSDPMIDPMIWAEQQEVARLTVRAFEQSRCSCVGFLSCGGSFRCVSCRREVGWCMGMAESEDCNDCWVDSDAGFDR